MKGSDPGSVAPVDGSPPIAPNLPRRPEVPGAASIGQNTLETLLFRGVSTPVALALVVLQSRFLEPAGRGSFILAVLTVTIVSRLLGQLGVAATNRLSAAGGDHRPLVLRALGLAGLVGGAGTLLLVGWSLVTEDVETELALLAACALIPNMAWQTVSGILLGLARVRVWNYVQLLPPLLTLVGMLVLVVALGGGVRAALLAWVLANAVTAAFALAASRDVWFPPDVPPLADRESRSILRLALVLGLVQIVNLVSYRIELFILRRYESLDTVGVYTIAMQTVESMWLAAAAVATAITAPVVHEGEQAAGRLVVRAAGKGLLYTVGIAAAVGVAAPFAIPLALGDDFSGATVPLLLLLPGVVVYAPVAILVVYLSVRRGRARLSLAVSLVSLVVTVAASLVLIPRYGGGGAAFASTLGYAVGGLCAWLLFVRLAGLTAFGRARRPAPVA